MTLPIPDPGRASAERYVTEHMGGLYAESGSDAVGSARFRGGQREADRRLKALGLVGYSRNRNNAYPEKLRSASTLSPYVRHGLIQLPHLLDRIGATDAEQAERDRFQTEIYHQEYARHWYARLGTKTRRPLRYRQVDAVQRSSDEAAAAWPRAMGCVELPLDELEEDGYLVGQTRLWLASEWAVRQGLSWRVGEDYMFRHLLDGSRAANRLGWQRTSGVGADRSYGFSRWQVERRAPGLCASCEMAAACPVMHWPSEAERLPVTPPTELHHDDNPDRTGGPTEPTALHVPDAVWLTAESLGMADPALSAHPELPVVFVFDRPLLERLQLSSKRLVFLVETLAEIALSRSLSVFLADPLDVLGGMSLAATFAPVPGWRSLNTSLDVVDVHPWPWIFRPGRGSIASFDEWLNDVESSQRFGSSPPPMPVGVDRGASLL